MVKGRVDEAVKDILKNGILLFESMVKQLDLYKDLRNMIEDIIYRGKRITFSPEQKSINLGVMFGFLKEARFIHKAEVTGYCLLKTTDLTWIWS